MSFGNRRGMTLVELIVAFTILALLTTMAVPLARYKVRRDRERELRYALREMRTAIDKYKDLADQLQLGTLSVDSDGYPESLEALVNGVKLTGTYDWGKRSTRDDPKSTSWGGQNIFDVYTKSIEKASDGTAYSEW